MTGKINIDKPNSFDPIRPERQPDVKGTQTPPIRPEPTKTASEKDRLNFSDKAAEVGKLVDTVKELPEVRADKVADVKAKIESGAFRPSGGEIADAILKDEQA